MTDASASPEQDMAAAIAHTAQTYDAVPYVALPFARLHPARLGAVARVLGLSPRPVSQARILEIGCATGGHVIPIAASYPNAQVVGLDISSRQIDLGKERIARLGLANIELQARSLTELCEADGSFDYIICHGVYSWIPEALREDLMRVVRERLAPCGLAVVSFNVLPGWRMYQVVRDSMILHAGAQTSHEERTAWTRFLFQTMENHAPENRTYGQIWRREAPRMSALPDYYLAHELFEDHNLPCTFTDFMATASRHGLSYLAESRFAVNIPENNPAELAKLARTFGQNDPVRTEQYIDIVTGRSFRESILIRNDLAGQVKRQLDPARLEHLYLVTPLGAEVRDNDDGTCRMIFDESESEITDVRIAGVMRDMLAARPATTSLASLTPDWTQPDRERLLATLLQLFQSGSIDLRTEPIDCTPQASAAPQVWSLAANDAAAGLDQTATLCQALYDLPPFARFLLPLLDGTRSYDTLLELVFEQARASGTTVTDASGTVTDPQRLREISGTILDRELARLARAGLLVH
jgi:methyltransferase-like protein/2-polyprenyl-3-methyl-5-hydroxy-6-metoxy-1,4-benzoquinol methylase